MNKKKGIRKQKLQSIALKGNDLAVDLAYRKRMAIWDNRINPRVDKCIKTVKKELKRIRKSEKHLFIENQHKAVLEIIDNTNDTKHTNVRRLCNKVLYKLEGLYDLQQHLPKRKQKNQFTSFVYTNKKYLDYHIGFLYEKIKPFLHQEVTKLIFKDAFRDQIVKTKINWKGSIKSLAYFIKQLVKNKDINGNLKWVKTVNSFLIDNKKIKRSSLRNAKDFPYELLKKINPIFREFNKLK